MENSVCVSAVRNFNINTLKEKLAALARPTAPDRRLVGDLLEPSDVAVLVTPIDEAAPKGRMILPQQQVLRDSNKRVSVVGRSQKARQQAENGHHGQSGFRNGEQNSSGRYSAHLIFDPHG